jgi:hypothetical protein
VDLVAVAMAELQDALKQLASALDVGDAVAVRTLPVDVRGFERSWRL